MQLAARLTTTEIAQILTSLLPLRIRLDGGETPDDAVGGQRWLDVLETLAPPSFEDGMLLLEAHARVAWPHRAMFDAFDIESVRVRVKPSLVSTPHGTGLKVTMTCDEIDIRWFPDFVDRLIAKRINERIREANLAFFWDFSELLTFRIDEESQRSNLTAVTFDMRQAEFISEADALVLSGPMQVGIERVEPSELDPSAIQALPASGAAS